MQALSSQRQYSSMTGPGPHRAGPSQPARPRPQPSSGAPRGQTRGRSTSSAASSVRREGSSSHCFLVLFKSNVSFGRYQCITCPSLSCTVGRSLVVFFCCCHCCCMLRTSYFFFLLSLVLIDCIFW